MARGSAGGYARWRKFVPRRSVCSAHVISPPATPTSFASGRDAVRRFFREGGGGVASYSTVDGPSRCDPELDSSYCAERVTAAQTSMRRRPLRSDRIQSLDRGLSIVDLLAGSDGALSVGEIAQLLDLNVSTVSRLAATLRERGIIAQYGRGGGYALGLSLFRYAHEVSQGRAARHIEEAMSWRRPARSSAVRPECGPP